MASPGVTWFRLGVAVFHVFLTLLLEPQANVSSCYFCGEAEMQEWVETVMPLKAWPHNCLTVISTLSNLPKQVP